MKKSMLFSILIMVGMTATLSFALETPYQNLGCWKDAIPRVMQTLEGNGNVSFVIDGHYKRRANAVQKCYKAALSLGFRVFAVQDGGQCFSSSAESTYNNKGPSSACLKDGKGGPMANEVYKMIDGFIKFSVNSVTTNKGNSYTLLCEFPHVKISHVGNTWACAWKTPNGQILNLWPNVKYEGGRIKQHGNLENQCGIVIENAEQRDNGKWQCQMTYVDKDNNAMPNVRDIDVAVANI